MSKVSEYRQHAKECRVLAHKSRSSEHRDMLLNMAATWESLADDRIKTAEGLKRMQHGRAVSVARSTERALHARLPNHSLAPGVDP